MFLIFNFKRKFFFLFLFVLSVCGFLSQVIYEYYFLDSILSKGVLFCKSSVEDKNIVVKKARSVEMLRYYYFSQERFNAKPKSFRKHFYEDTISVNSCLKVKFYPYSRLQEIRFIVQGGELDLNCYCLSEFLCLDSIGCSPPLASGVP